MTTYAWATWLPAALATDPFVEKRMLIGNPNWATAGRPGSFLPTGVVDHHTACMLRLNHDPQTDINTILAGNSVAPGPISQLLGTFTPPGTKWNGKNVDPRIIILAAGRSNHAGAGEYPWGAPGGNGSSIGIEWCGPPEEGWPDEVIELRARVTAALLRWNNWPTAHSTIHWEYARPLGRKIDPSSSYVDEPGLPVLGHWDPDKWRNRVSRYIVLPHKPDPDPQPIDPPIITNPPTEGEQEVSYEIIDYGLRPGSPELGPGQKPDSWWTEFGLTSRGLCWSGAPRSVDVASFMYHQMAELLGKKPMFRFKNDAEVISYMQRYGTTGPVPSTFAANANLTAKWKQFSNDK